MKHKQLESTIPFSTTSMDWIPSFVEYSIYIYSLGLKIPYHRGINLQLIYDEIDKYGT